MIETLMLLENPGRRYKYNPRHRVSKRRNTMSKRNPAGLGGLTKEWFGGMDIMEMGAALGGLAAATMIPGMIITTTTTTANKVMKAIASFVCAIGAGFIARNVSPGAGKAAMTGGIAGALAQTVGLFTTIKIGGPMQLNAPTFRPQMSQIRQTPGPGFEELKTY